MAQWNDPVMGHHLRHMAHRVGQIHVHAPYIIRCPAIYAEVSGMFIWDWPTVARTYLSRITYQYVLHSAAPRTRKLQKRAPHFPFAPCDAGRSLADHLAHASGVRPQSEQCAQSLPWVNEHSFCLQ
eukprot:627354-Pelagomonas_calceolata.AAC.1